MSGVFLSVSVFTLISPKERPNFYILSPKNVRYFNFREIVKLFFTLAQGSKSL